ncbi:hypothetical protein [Nocardia sp. NPDC051570]|uniref:hypothetical protein n=1 Tax=Nocardia sp. NPDC051570 TaxID=3364324 RepID=UPI00379F863E
MSQPDSSLRPPEDSSKRQGDSSGSPCQSEPAERKSLWREPAVVAAIIAMISAVVVAVITVNFGDKKNPPSASSPAGTVSATAIPATGPTLKSEPAVETTAPPSAAWTLAFNDKEINVKPLSEICPSWNINLETATAQDANTVNTDLSGTGGCGNGYGVNPDHGAVWGESSTMKPTPEQCVDAAKVGSLGLVSFDTFAPGTAYCVVTHNRNVAWVRVVRRVGANGTGFDLAVTVWAPHK